MLLDAAGAVAVLQFLIADCSVSADEIFNGARRVLLSSGECREILSTCPRARRPATRASTTQSLLRLPLRRVRRLVSSRSAFSLTGFVTVVVPLAVMFRRGEVVACFGSFALGSSVITGSGSFTVSLGVGSVFGLSAGDASGDGVSAGFASGVAQVLARASVPSSERQVMVQRLAPVSVQFWEFHPEVLVVDPALSPNPYDSRSSFFNLTRADQNRFVA